MATGGTDKRKKSWWERLTARYRLVLLNDETFEEVTSFRLSRMNVYVLVSTILVILVAVTVSAIVYTPLKEYIPGYTDVNVRRDILLMKLKSDSLERAMLAHEKYLWNIRRIISGELPAGSLYDTLQQQPAAYDSIDPGKISPAERELRQHVEQEERFQVSGSGSRSGKTRSSITGVHFFPPVKGYVTSRFDASKQHFAVDVVAPENEAIKATLNGIVVFAEWTSQTGYVLAIQHEGSLLSIYKHNSVLLKEPGDHVRAGDVVAIIGSTGELSSGPHLHFEIWHNGLPLNPEDYLVFE